MDKRDQKLLEDDGWTIDCESPFEISDKDGNRATGRAADYVLSHLDTEASIGPVCCECGKDACQKCGGCKKCGTCHC